MRRDSTDEPSLKIDRLNFTAQRFIRAADKIKLSAQNWISGAQLDYDILTFESEKLAL